MADLIELHFDNDPSVPLAPTQESATRSMLSQQPSFTEDKANESIRSLDSPSITDTLGKFMVDPSVDGDVIHGCQERLFNLSDIMKITRRLCYGIHRRRLQLLGRLRK